MNPILACTAAIALGGAAVAGPVTVTDHSGREVTVEAPVENVAVFPCRSPRPSSPSMAGLSGWAG